MNALQAIRKKEIEIHITHDTLSVSLVLYFLAIFQKGWTKLLGF